MNGLGATQGEAGTVWSSDYVAGSLATLRAACESALYTPVLHKCIVVMLLPCTGHYGEIRTNIARDIVLASNKVILKL